MKDVAAGVYRLLREDKARQLTGALKTLDGHLMVVALESSRENAVNLFHSGIFIFSMKKKIRNMFIDVIQIQAFELLVFTRIKSKTSPPILRVVIFASKGWQRPFWGISSAWVLI